MKEQRIIEYYKKNWPYFVKLWQVDKTHCIHYGYYESGVETHIQSILKMNDFVGKLMKLDFENNKAKNVLDVGCGIGGTVVHLAKKYPNIKFIGVDIVPGHIEMAKQLAKDNQVNNAKFFNQDFSNMGFSRSTFDIIYALESINYSKNIRDHLGEMHRILISNGKLIVIDGFRTNIRLNSFLQKFYNWFCEGRAITSLVSIEEIKLTLKFQGFKEIKDINLTNTIKRSVVRGNLLSIPYLILTLIKKIIKGKKYRINDDPAFPAAVSILASMIGLKKGITYNAITAVKK